jgi:hypothetical protein
VIDVVQWTVFGFFNESMEKASQKKKEKKERLGSNKTNGGHCRLVNDKVYEIRHDDLVFVT